MHRSSLSLTVMVFDSAENQTHNNIWNSQVMQTEEEMGFYFPSFISKRPGEITSSRVKSAVEFMLVIQVQRQTKELLLSKDPYHYAPLPYCFFECCLSLTWWNIYHMSNMDSTYSFEERSSRKQFPTLVMLCDPIHRKVQ